MVGANVYTYTIHWPEQCRREHETLSVCWLASGPVLHTAGPAPNRQSRGHVAALRLHMQQL